MTSATCTHNVYIEAPFKLHIGYHRKELIPYPPEGYAFVTGGGGEDIFLKASKFRFGFAGLETLNYRLPLIYSKSLADLLYRRPPPSTSLTYSCHHLILRDEPWVLESQGITEVVGANLAQFLSLRRRVADVLKKPNCKKIMFFTEYARKSCLRALDCSSFEEKLDVLPRAVHPKRFTRSVSNRVRFLFVGSANVAGLFNYRGGVEAMEAFSRVARSRENIELCIRSDVPRWALEKYGGMIKSGKIKIMNRSVPLSELEALYSSSDVFLFPSHYESWQIALEAMSFEIPVVALNVEGMSEIVRDGKTGILLDESKLIPQIYHNGLPIPTIAPCFKKAVLAGPYDDLLEQIEVSMLRLIDNESLRLRMGAAARQEVETGTHSLETRNAKLKEVFDFAISGG